VSQTRSGACTLTVTCCSTFHLAPGESPLVTAPAEPPLAEGDERRYVEPWGPIVPWKRRVDVIVVGHAHAPDDAPVRELVARVAVGDVDKAITIRGDSWFMADGSLTEPALFTRMPLRWERSAGGPRTANPIGMPMGAQVPVNRWGRVPVPNLVPFGVVVTARSDVTTPVGFGPIRPEWPVRVDRLRGHAAGWDASRWAERPLPDDLDPFYFNVSPRDQMLDELGGDERIVIENLHPRHPQLVTRLRAPSPRAITKLTGVEQSISLRCDTLVIDTDRGRAALVWRGQIAIDSPQRDGVVLISAGDLGATSTLPASVARAAAELPFRRAQPGALSLADGPASEAPTSALPFAQEAADSAIDATGTLPGSAVGSAVELPFRRAQPGELSPGDSLAAEAPAPARSFAQAPAGGATETIVAAFKAPTRPLPFRASSSPSLDEPEETEPTQRHQAVPVEQPPSSKETAKEIAAPAWILSALPAAAPAAAPLPEWTPRPDEEPPPLIGPLAHVALPVPEAAEPVAPPEPAPEPEPPPEVAGPPIEKYSLERCAAIAARIDRRPEAYAKVLEHESLDLPTWEALDEHWRGVVDADVARGRRKVLAAYDEAYVGALEVERGPITAAEYARLIVASERGSAESVLGELGLPSTAMMRIRRVWLGRTVRDARAAEALRLAMRAASEG
jgi:hypothetical protein